MVDHVAALEQRLDVGLTDAELVDRALTHRSYAFERGLVATNERLEFLGDAVLAVVVTDLVFHQLPAEDEGTLAKLRAAAVRTSELADVGRELGLGDLVRLGKGEAESGGADKDSILADTFEAVLGAVYLDRGIGAATELVRRLFTPRLRELATRGAALDYKTSLQELTAARFEALPDYHLTEEGPDHRKTFTARVEIGGDVLGSGRGPSKKKAEQAAAQSAYLDLVGDLAGDLTGDLAGELADDLTGMDAEAQDPEGAAPTQTGA